MKKIITAIQDLIIILVFCFASLALFLCCLITGGAFNDYFYSKFYKLYDYIGKLIGE